ncbi:hypothetical protein ACFQZ4_15090 [Catellatospora coxensis]
MAHQTSARGSPGRQFHDHSRTRGQARPADRTGGTPAVAATGLARHAVFNGAWTVGCCASVHTGPGCRPMSLMPN